MASRVGIVRILADRSQSTICHDVSSSKYPISRIEIQDIMIQVLSTLDVLVLLKLAIKHDRSWTQPQVAGELLVSQSVVSRALRSAEKVGLYSAARRRVNGRRLADALVHGARYFLAAEQGGEVRGMKTAWAAPPLNSELSSAGLLPPVWPDAQGETRGFSVEPLHPNVPEAARRDNSLYEILSLVDVLRIDSEARVRNLAQKEVIVRLERK
jgi:hypothetical protein